MKFTICHPSFKRPIHGTKAIKNTISKWSKNNELEYLLILETVDPTINEYKVNLSADFDKIIFSNQNSWAGAINIAAKQATGNVIIVTADDFIFPDKWDILLASEINKHPEMNDDFVISINDGNRTDNLITLPICSKKYYDKIGYMIYPEYISVYGDNDFTEMAYFQQKVIEAKHLLFKHNHYRFGGNIKKDETYQKVNDRNLYRSGKEILSQRRARNFDL